MLRACCVRWRGQVDASRGSATVLSRSNPAARGLAPHPGANMRVSSHTSPPRVGHPTHESELTSALLAAPGAFVRPGTGRQTFLITEVPFPAGRPDVVAAVVSPALLARRARLGLRLANFTEARVLAALIQGTVPGGISHDHARAVARRVEALGWMEALRHSVVRAASDSLLIEAKRSEWRKGISQILRNRRQIHRAALLIPSDSARLINESSLRRADCGLIVFDRERRQLSWAFQGKAREPSLAADLWLAELAIRATLGRSRAP